MGHQLLDRLAPVVASHVRVQVEPDTLDPVVVRAVRWEEVKHDPVVELRQEALGLLAGVNDVIVQDEVDPLRVPVLADELPHELTEEVAGLGRPFHAGQLAGRCVEGTGDVALLVLPRGDDHASMSLGHPVASDLRVEMDVHLVLVEDRLLLGTTRRQTPQGPQNTLPSLAIPRAQHDRPWCLEARADGAQGTAHRAGSDSRQAASFRFQAQQLARPGRALPAKFGRYRRQQALQLDQEVSIDLGLAVEGPLVEQPLFPFLDEAAGRLDDRGRDAGEIASNLLSGEPLSELSDHEETESCLWVSCLSASENQSPSRGAIESGYRVQGKVASIVVSGLATATIDGLTFPFNFLSAFRGSTSDLELRTVV